MSCIPEWALGAYVDDGLSADEVRDLESHLVGCEHCRRNVVALREEARLLALALSDAVAEPTEEVDVAPARGLALGLPATVAAVAAVATAVSALLESELPRGTAWLHPSRLLGVNEMILDVLFTLRDQAPGWLELGVALAALASLAAVGSFVAGVIGRRVSPPAALLAVPWFLLLVAPPAEAVLDLRWHESVVVAEDETIDATLLVSGDSLVIEGRVNGDVLVFAERVVIRGTVAGNVIGGGREVEISGTIEGTAIVGGEDIRFDGNVTRDAYVGSDGFRLGADGRVGRDLFVFGERVAVAGEVARDLTVGGDRFDLTGSTGRDFQGWVDRIELASSARVGGDVQAHLMHEDRFVVADGALVSGETEISEFERHKRDMWSHYREGRYWSWVLLGFAGSFLVGLALYAVLPGLFAGSLRDGGAFLSALGVGFLAIVATPVALTLLGLTLVGLPAALIGFAFYFVALYVGGLLVAGLIGRSILPGRGDSLGDFGLVLLVGLAVTVTLKVLPFVGFAVKIVLPLLGLGLLISRARAMVGGAGGGGGYSDAPLPASAPSV